MGTITLPNLRTTADVTMNTRLKDGDVTINWAGLTDIKAWLYSDAQKAIAGRCDVSVSETDSTNLTVRYAATKPQYLGINRLIVQAQYMGELKTYDKPAFNFVRWTDDQADTPITISDPDVDVEIVVTDVSSSILDAAIAAALQAAADAEHAAHLIPNQVLLDCEAATAAALDAASKAPYIDETTGNWFVWDATAGEYVNSGKPSRGATGNGIASWSVVESEEDGGSNVVTVTFTDGNSETFTYKNGHTGNGIASIVQTVESPDDAGTNVITVTMTNGTVVTFNVKNGSKGQPGAAQAAYKSVNTLPTASAATMDKIYLTPSGTSGVYNMSYTDYDGSAYSWVDLGTTAIQLSDYATKAEVTQLEAEINGNNTASATGSGWTFVSLSPAIPKGAVITGALLNGVAFASTFFFKDGDGNQYNVAQSSLPYTAPEELETVTLGQTGAITIEYQVPGLKQRTAKNETDIASVSAIANSAQSGVNNLDYEVNGDGKSFAKQAGYNNQYVYFDFQLKAGKTYKFTVKPNTLYDNGNDMGQLYINSPRSLLIGNVYSGFESTFTATADSTGDLLLYCTQANMKDTSGTLHDIELEIYSNLGVVEEEKVPKTYPKTMAFYGRNATAQTTTIETKVGHTYRIYFLTRTWAWSGIGSGNNAFVLRDANGNTVYGFSPAIVPDGFQYKDFVAKTSTYDILIRGNLGETIQIAFDEITDLFDKSVVAYNGGYTNILERITTLKTKSMGASSPSRFNLVFYSDIHNGAENNQRIADFFVTFKSHLDDVIHGGDSVYDSFSDTNTVAAYGGQSFLNVVGNHDVNKGGGELATGLEYYNKFIAPNVAKWGDVVFPEDAATEGYCYYYKDYSGANVRLIALDCMHWDATQKSWFESVLADAVANEISVICVSHYCMDRFPTMISDCTFCSLYTDDVNAGLNSEAEDAVADAIDNGLDFVCWLFGHTHRDYFVKSHNHPEQFGVGVDRGYGGVVGDGDGTREEGTRFYDSFDIISVDTKSKILTVTKIGKNADMYMRQKNFLVFKYDTHEILSNS